NELRGLRPISGESVDTRLYHLWLLLDQTDGATTRHAIASVAPLVPMLGAELAAALQDALIQHWRHWQPRLKSSRAANELNQISNIDCMGIAGISLEEGTRPHWADRLTADEARLAACYATVEINGLPSWLAALAIAKPTEVRSVLVTEVMAELSGSEPKKRFGILEDLSRADKPVIELMAPSLFTELENRNNLVPEALAPMLSIVARGLRDSRQKFVELAINRFNSTDDAHVCGLYLGVVFAVDSTAATDALMARLDTLQAAAQKTLVEQILPNVFDTGFRSVNSAQPDLTFESLERLVTIAFRTIRAEDDNYRPSGEAFSPDQRDNAQHARNAAFQQLSETPGRSTYDALLRLAENPDCPISRTRLYELAHDRAARDSESSPWPPSETVAFE